MLGRAFSCHTHPHRSQSPTTERQRFAHVSFRRDKIEPKINITTSKSATQKHQQAIPDPRPGAAKQRRPAADAPCTREHEGGRPARDQPAAPDPQAGRGRRRTSDKSQESPTKTRTTPETSESPPTPQLHHPTFPEPQTGKSRHASPCRKEDIQPRWHAGVRGEARPAHGMHLARGCPPAQPSPL